MSKRIYIDQKGSRNSIGRASRPKKKKGPVNRYLKEMEIASTSTAAEKLKDESLEPEINATFGYRILNFVAVFSAISEHVKCKDCGGDVQFMESSIRGLGFKILIKCDSCSPKGISSCPLIGGHAYDINRRIVFAMRLLGHGLAGIQKFCGIMDLPTPITQKAYSSAAENIRLAAKAVCDSVLETAGKEEERLTATTPDCTEPSGLTVSGNATWRKRGLSSLHGVTTLVGYHSKKVLDIIIKSSHCDDCAAWENKDDTEEFAEWQETHADECLANRIESARKMEVNAVQEMFQRSEKIHNTKYSSYLGDGDSETFHKIIQSKPYSDIDVRTKESIVHVRKRMGSQLRNIKKHNKEIGAGEKLTGKLIDELALSYGLAIQRNCHSIEDMRNAIWATFHHKISTDEDPQHHLCPVGTNSWCTWQKAHAGGSLAEYRHEPALPQDVQDVIRPIYTALSAEDLLDRCLGGYDQNDNENMNSVVWKIAPKIYSSGDAIVDTAAYIAACTFNGGALKYLDMMQILNLKIGDKAYQWCVSKDTSCKQYLAD